MSICREFLSNHGQRVVVDGGSTEWITIVLGMPQGSVLDSVHSIYQRNVLTGGE